MNMMPMGPPPISPTPPMPPQMPQEQGGMNPILMLLIKMLMGGGEQQGMAPPPVPPLAPGTNFPAADPTADPQMLAQRYLNGRNV